MGKQQAQQLIQDTFDQSFDREQHERFLRELLNNIVPGHHAGKRYSGKFLPEAFKPHIRQYWCLGKYVDPENEELEPESIAVVYPGPKTISNR